MYLCEHLSYLIRLTVISGRYRIVTLLTIEFQWLRDFNCFTTLVLVFKRITTKSLYKFFIVIRYIR